MNGIRELSASEKLQWLRLIRSQNVGPVSFRQLISKFGSAEEALRVLPELSLKGGASKAIRVYPKQQAEAEYERLRSLGGQLIASCEPSYPAFLREIHDLPPVISVLGHAQLLQKDSIGIVGSRNASAVSINLTRSFARELGRNGYVVVSGLARGIDSAAHVASLEHGTIAVVAGGVDVVYPKENQSLYEQIIDQGCIIAEQPFGTEPQARHFPRRNRIISGMAKGVLVMEATPKSGSLITARMALEQNREVFAVPGSPMDPRARGTNNLIRNGAVLVESADEIITELNTVYRTPLREPEQYSLEILNDSQTSEQILESTRPTIISLLGPTPTEIDDLIRHSGEAPSTILTILLELELAGRIERHFGNRVSLIQ